MTFPVIATTNTTADTSSTSVTVNMPASISAGDLLIVIVAQDVTGTITQSGGSDWTKIEQVNDSAAQCSYALFAKIAAGSDTLTLTSTNSQDAACVALRITGHGVSNVSTDIKKGTAANPAANAAPNPPDCNQGTVQDNLWIELFAADDDDDTATYWSANYTGVAQIQSASSTSSCLCAVASRNLNASSENPAVMAMALTEEWIAQTLGIPPAAASQVTNTWNLRHDLASAVTNTWNLRHDMASAVTNTWTIRYDMSGSVTNTWNLRHDLLNSVEQIWNLRHDLSQAVSNTWNLRHDLAAQVEEVWNLRHDLASKIENIWNLRHDLLSSISRIWTFRHDLLADEVEPPAVVENPVRGFKTANRPKFWQPLEKELTIKFRIPLFWVKKYNIKLDLPIWYDVIYEKRLTTYSIKEENIKIPTSIYSTIKAKMNIFVESVQNITLKPDYRLEKFIRLTKLQRLLRESSLNE